MCENSAQELRGCTVVKLEHPAQPLAALHVAWADRGGLGRDNLVAQTLVRPFLMIVIDKRLDGVSKVRLAEWYDSRQTLESDRSDKSFRKGV